MMYLSYVKSLFLVNCSWNGMITHRVFGSENTSQILDISRQHNVDLYVARAAESRCIISHHQLHTTRLGHSRRLSVIFVPASKRPWPNAPVKCASRALLFLLALYAPATACIVCTTLLDEGEIRAGKRTHSVEELDSWKYAHPVYIYFTVLYFNVPFKVPKIYNDLYGAVYLAYHDHKINSLPVSRYVITDRCNERATTSKYR